MTLTTYGCEHKHLRVGYATIGCLDCFAIFTRQERKIPK